MNIFYLCHNTDQCAEQMCDKHVVKMVVETAQLLSTAHHVLDNNSFNDRIYKVSHQNHPCAIWCRETSSNYEWLFSMLVSLLKEYTYRYRRIHKTAKTTPFLELTPANIPIGDFTTPPKAMPDKYKTNDVIQSYRNYYIGDKHSFATWKNRKVPEWFTIGEQ